MTEAELQRDVIRFLGVALIQPAAFVHVPNNPRNAIAGRNLKALGLKKGCPDLLIFAQGKTVAVELKTPRGKVSEHQKAMLQLLLDCGIFTAICRSVDDVESALKFAGIKLKARAA